MLKKEITILIGGAAGDGIQTIGGLLARVCHRAGLYIFSVDDFESRIRGGHSYHLLRIAGEPLSAPSAQVDILVAIDKTTYEVHKDQVRTDGVVLMNQDAGEPAGKNVYPVSLVQLAKEAGGQIASNTVAAGAVLSMIGADFEDFSAVLKEEFGSRGEKVLQLNLAAAQKGYDFGSQIQYREQFDFAQKDHSNVTLTGAKAAALGALAADCRFFSFYPMSPGTGIMTQAAGYSDRMPIVMEQAEDEIAAINMAIGASFAGVRSLVSTSGGGFCLMTEGLGLSAISETPVVVINAQRPGPATGLATRTAQADLLFVLNASQDEFPRFVFAPGSPKEVFNTVKKAFRLSEKYQVPAIILMDQYLIDSNRTEPGALEIGSEHESFLDQETELSQEETYLRYRITDTGISPRKVPCVSDALVRVLGNEHVEEGFSTEEPDIRVQMVEKRFRKLPSMKAHMRMPSVFCDNSSFYLTGWGSTKGSIMEACLHLREQGINAGWIIFEDIWPLDGASLNQVLKDKKMIMVEGNYTSQLGALIRQLTGLEYCSSILKYDGRPIYPEFIIEKARQIMGK